MQKAVGLSGALGSRYRPINAATDEITRALEQKAWRCHRRLLQVSQRVIVENASFIDLSEQEAFEEFGGDAEMILLLSIALHQRNNSRIGGAEA